jgi:mannosyltransferase
LWRDELATWSAAFRPTEDLLRLVRTIDAVTAPYYLFMHAWGHLFGDSVLALRLPAVLSMTGAAGLTALLGDRLFGARTGLVAGLLFAVVPSTSRYGQEARPYAFATLFAVLATLLLVGALQRPTWARWAGYAIGVLGLGLAHLVAVLLVAGHAVAVLLAWRAGRDRRLLRWLVALAATAVLLAPLAVLGQGQRGRQLGWVGPSRFSQLLHLPETLTQAATVGGMLVALAAVAVALRGRWGTVLGASVLLPVALLFVAGRVTPLWVTRYLVFTVPFLCLLAAAALSGLRLRFALPIVAVACLLGAPAQAALRRTHESPRTALVDYRAAAQIIAVNQRPGDGIVYSPRTGSKFLDTAVAYHLGANRPRDLLVVQDQIRRADLRATECGEPARCLANAHRVWLLVVGEKVDPLQGMPEPKRSALSRDFRVGEVRRVPGLTVALLTRRPT